MESRQQPTHHPLQCFPEPHSGSNEHTAGTHSSSNFLNAAKSGAETLLKEQGSQWMRRPQLWVPWTLAQQGESLIKSHTEIQTAQEFETILPATPYRDSDKTSSRFTSPERVLSSNQLVKLLVNIAYPSYFSINHFPRIFLRGKTWHVEMTSSLALLEFSVYLIIYSCIQHVIIEHAPCFRHCTKELKI